MFEIKTILGNLTIIYKLDKNKTLEFPIDDLLTTRAKSSLDRVNVIKVLNAYLDHKGVLFKEKLYKEYSNSLDILYKNIRVPSVYPLPLNAVHNILDLFDLKEVKEFIINSRLITTPDMIKDEFDETIIQNDEGSREQTYTTSDYYDLVALLTILRFTMPILGIYTSYKQGILSNSIKEYTLVHFYTSHKIVDTEPFQKLFGFINKILDNAKSNPLEFSKIIIDKLIAKEEYDTYLLGLLIFQRFLPMSEIVEFKDKNLITQFYNYIASKAGIKTLSNTNKINIKTPAGANIDNAFTGESTLEMFRVSTIPPGYVVEYNHAYSDAKQLAKWVGVKNLNMVSEMVDYLSELKHLDLPDSNLILISWIFKDVIDPRTIEYIKIDGIINGLSAAYVFLYENDLKELGLLLTTYVQKNEQFTLNHSVKHKFTQENEKILDEMYPNLERINSKNGIMTKNFVAKSINSLLVEYSKDILISVLPQDVLSSNYDLVKPVIMLPSNFRNDIVKLLMILNNYQPSNED